MNRIVDFHGVACTVDTSHQYGNGRPAIELIIQETGEPMARASVNLPSLRLDPGEIAIKDYSENEGMLECLISHKVVELLRYEDNWPIVKLINNEETGS